MKTASAVKEKEKRKETKHIWRISMNRILCSVTAAAVAATLLAGCDNPFSKKKAEDNTMSGYSYTAEQYISRKQVRKLCPYGIIIHLFFLSICSFYLSKGSMTERLLFPVSREPRAFMMSSYVTAAASSRFSYIPISLKSAFIIPFPTEPTLLNADIISP